MRDYHTFDQNRYNERMQLEPSFSRDFAAFLAMLAAWLMLLGLGLFIVI